MAVFLNAPYDQGVFDDSTSEHALSTAGCAPPAIEEVRVSYYDNERRPYLPGNRTQAYSPQTKGEVDRPEVPVPSNLSNTQDVPTAGLPRLSIGQIKGDVSAPPPSNRLAKLKFYYDRSPLRHFGPFLLLAIYALAGACLFYGIEHRHEVRLIQRGGRLLESLRNDTLERLRVSVLMGRRQSVMMNVLDGHESQAMRIRVPEGIIAWDMWGALFYVGTVFTTIGYGNITPRTVTGQAFSIVYAIVGIPLVLAILNQFGKKLTRFMSEQWIKYREHVRLQRIRQLRHVKLKLKQHQDKDKQSAKALRANHVATEEVDLESATNRKTSQAESKISGTGGDESEGGETSESRTIPIWVASAVCIGYICTIAALFCIWERRWSYFTSFYFICISCLTIGLGDVIPDHPRMLILMFVFVILGLSMVSMLISVIQIRMEEWLYKMMIKMQKEYQMALERGEPLEHGKLMEEMLKNEPWFMRNLATMCITDNQAAKLDEKAETFEKVLRSTNNKSIQTDIPSGAVQPLPAGADIDSEISSSVAMFTALEDPTSVRQMPIARESLLKASAQDLDSISDVASLPADPVMGKFAKKKISLATESVQTERSSSLCDQTQQTEIVQSHMDKLMKLEAQASKHLVESGTQCGECVQRKDAAVGSGSVKRRVVGIQVPPLFNSKHKSTETDCKFYLDRSIEAYATEVVHRSMETSEIGWEGESKSTQTEEDEDYDFYSSSVAGRRQKFLRRIPEFEISIAEQGEAVGTEVRDVTTQTIAEQRPEEPILFAKEQQNSPFPLLSLPIDGADRWSCSESVVAFSGQEEPLEAIQAFKPPVIKQDLVIQTDDSYLRIAKRLDAYRTNQGQVQNLQICVAPVRHTIEDPTRIQRPGLSANYLSSNKRRDSCSPDSIRRPPSVRWKDEEEGGGKTSATELKWPVAGQSSISQPEEVGPDASGNYTVLSEAESPTSPSATSHSIAQKIRQSFRRKKKTRSPAKATSPTRVEESQPTSAVSS